MDFIKQRGQNSKCSNKIVTPEQLKNYGITLDIFEVTEEFVFEKI